MAYQDGDCTKEPQSPTDDAIDVIEALGFRLFREQLPF